jgi:anti-sigma factor RsiW
MMTYVGCEYAREHLDAFVDGELSVDEQVAVESHLRWCRTCAARVEDMQLIGNSIRLGSLVPRVDD